MANGERQAGRDSGPSASASRSAKTPDHEPAGWSTVKGAGSCKTFSFPTSTQVLVFAVRVSQVARRAGQARVEVRQGFGNVTVRLTGAGDSGAQHSLIKALEEAASIVDEWDGAAGIQAIRCREQCANRR